MPEKPKCSFCGKPRNEVKALLGDSKRGVLICDRCALTAAAAFQKQSQEEAEAKNEVTLLKPQEGRAFLDQYIIGQDVAKDDIAIAVYNHFKRREALKRGEELDTEIKKSNILFMGPSGTGKTETARTVSKMLNVPFYVADATKMTQAGYVGDDVETMLQGLLADASGDVERAEWGIIFIDEIDKLARKTGRGATGYRDVTGEGVQQALLKIIEGCKSTIAQGHGRLVSADIQASSTIDTTNVLFICAGSFDGIQETIGARVNKAVRVGFGAADRRELEPREVYSSVEEEDVLDFGIIPELLGRLPIMTSTLPLTEEEMVEILTKPKNALVKQYQALFRMDGQSLEFEEDALKAVGRQAMKSPRGARALRSILEKILKPAFMVCPSDPDITTVRITEDVVEGKCEPILVRKPQEEKPKVKVELKAEAVG
jgi:ATP-dependent Clp protease ATP-binding subunit ClpX